MKKRLLAGVLIALACCAGAWAGYSAAGREALRDKEARSRVLLTFAAGHIAGLKDGYDQDVMEAVISDVYAAYEYESAVDADRAAALHELWNALVFDGEHVSGNEDALIAALQGGGAGEIEGAAYTLRNAG